MKIEVKRSYIRKGIQNSQNNCPIAISVRKSFGIDNVEVNCGDMKIGKRKFDLPLEAQDFITAFDDNKSSVEPFSFEI